MGYGATSESGPSARRSLHRASSPSPLLNPRVRRWWRSSGTGTTVQTPPATREQPRPTCPSPPAQGTVDGSGTSSLSLQVGSGTTTFRAGVATRTLGYNGALLGPAPICAGENGSASMCRTAWRSRPPCTGTAWTCRRRPTAARTSVALWRAHNGARTSPSRTRSTCWYHPTRMAPLGARWVISLAGLLVIDDPAIGSAGLPNNWGVDDVVRWCWDKRFDKAAGRSTTT